MRRREFIAGFGGAVATWPLAARAQLPDRMRRVGVLTFGTESDPARQPFLAAFRNGLRDLGWIEGRNLRIDVRFGRDPDQLRAAAQELVNLAPDVMVSNTSPATRATLQQTRTIPIIFIGVSDPVLNGLVGSISRPDGNITGITNLFPSVGSKWLELLAEVVPRLARVGIIVNTELPSSYLPVIEAAAAESAVKAIRIPVRNATEFERAVEAFAAEPNGGLIVLPPVPGGAIGEAIRRLPIKELLPTIYPSENYISGGALMSYGPDNADLYRRCASYVDRILRGAQVSELPVQFPTKFKLVINLKTAKAMGLEIPPTVLAIADEVIE
jgi:putative ABC transport system substrate-binding protein